MFTIGWAMRLRGGHYQNLMELGLKQKMPKLFCELAEPVSHDLIFSFNACPFVAPNHKRLVVDISANDTSLKTLDYVYEPNDKLEEGDCDTLDRTSQEA